MALTPVPTSLHLAFVIGEAFGGGDDGKTHWCLSTVGRGPVAYYNNNQRRGTPERFAALAAKFGSRVDEDSFGLEIDSRWKPAEVKQHATVVLNRLYDDLRKLIAAGEYSTVVIDSITFVKALAFAAEWGNDPPLKMSKKTGKMYPDQREVYGPVNRKLEELYSMFRNQTLRTGKDGKLVGTSLMMTSEGRCVHDADGNATDVYEPHAAGRIDFYTDIRVCVAGPLRGSRANTITYHKGGSSINKLGKPFKRVEAPESLKFLLGVDLAEWGRGPDVPPSFAPATCENPKCRKEGLEYAKVDGEWLMVEVDGSVHNCKTGA